MTGVGPTARPPSSSTAAINPLATDTNVTRTVASTTILVTSPRTSTRSGRKAPTTMAGGASDEAAMNAGPMSTKDSQSADSTRNATNVVDSPITIQAKVHHVKARRSS